MWIWISLYFFSFCFLFPGVGVGLKGVDVYKHLRQGCQAALGKATFSTKGTWAYLPFAHRPKVTALEKQSNNNKSQTRNKLRVKYGWAGLAAVKSAPWGNCVSLNSSSAEREERVTYKGYAGTSSASGSHKVLIICFAFYKLNKVAENGRNQIHWV